MIGLTNIFSAAPDMSNAPIAAIYGHKSGTSYSTPLNSVRVSYNRDYFTYSDGVFTVKKACSIVISAFTSPRNNPNSGKTNTATHKILINGTSQGESTKSTSTLSCTLTVNDTIQYQCKGSTSGGIGGGIGINLSA